MVIVVTRCRPLKFHIQRIIDNRWDMEVNDSGGRGHISPPTETLLDVKSWTCCLPHERTGRDGVTKVHPASTTITRVIWKTCIGYYLYKATMINSVRSCSGLNYNYILGLIVLSINLVFFHGQWQPSKHIKLLKRLRNISNFHEQIHSFKSLQGGIISLIPLRPWLT